MAVIDTYFRELKQRGASDLHMVIGFPPLLRLHGELKPTDQPVLTPDSNRDILFEILEPEQQAYLEKNRDFDMAYELGDEARFRCPTFFTSSAASAPSSASLSGSESFFPPFRAGNFLSSNKKSPKNAWPAQFTPSGFPNSASCLQGRFDAHPCFSKLNRPSMADLPWSARAVR